MQHLPRLYERFLTVLGMCLMVFLTFIVAYQLFSRQFAALPFLLWTQEAARFAFLWMIMIGAAIAVRRQTHFVVDLLPASASLRTRKISYALILATMAVTCAGIAYSGFLYVSVASGRISVTSGIPMVWVYLAVPFGACSMLVFIAEQIVTFVRTSSLPEDPNAPYRQESSVEDEAKS